MCLFDYPSIMMNLQLSILTLNIWGIPFVSQDRKARVEAIGKELATDKYDIISLQEVWSESDYQALKDQTKTVLPYSHYFYSGVVGSGLCVFSKYPIVTAFFHAWSVNGYVHRVHHGDWFGGKGVGMVKIAVGNQIVHFYCAHLHAEYDRHSDDYQAHRVVQAFDTAQFLENTRGNAVVQILAGDLNTEPGDLAYRVLVLEANLTDAYDPKSTRFGTNECPSNSYTSLTEKLSLEAGDGKRIDYILYRGGFKYNIERTQYTLPLPNFVPGANYSYSDHEAVLTHLHVTKKGQVVNPNTEYYPEGREVFEPKSAENVATIMDSIRVCEESLAKIDHHRVVYLTLALVVVFMLFQIIDMKPGYGLGTLYLLVKIALSGLALYLVFMGTLWNKLEKHGILAGKLAMEISLKNKYKC